MDYSEKMEAIKAKFEPRIKTIMEGIREAIRDEGYTTGEVFDMSCDEYQWALLVAGDKTLQAQDYNPSELNEDDIDIQFTILESHYCDGSENGVTFGVSVNTVGGRMQSLIKNFILMQPTSNP